MASGSCVPHQQAEHMTALTKPRTTSMKTLANGEPSTHDPLRTLAELIELGLDVRFPRTCSRTRAPCYSYAQRSRFDEVIE
jgi:hypothetical protein